MHKRMIAVAALAAVVVLTAASFAFGGPRALIWDDGHYAKAGMLDDGKDLLPLTTVSLGSAIATAQHAAGGAVGQVDLERWHGAVVYMVDVGDQEVRVDATTGDVVAIGPRD